MLLRPAPVASSRSSLAVLRDQIGVDQSLRSKKSAKAIPIHDIEGLAIEWTPYVQGKPSAGSKDPSHFPHACGTIREVLQPLLAKHDLEAAISKGQISSTAEMPVYVW